jgi:hypothetical protein
MTAGAPLDPMTVVGEWHRALNDQDQARVLTLAAPEIEIVGPRGAGHGVELLSQWLASTRVDLLPVESYARGDSVVVVERAVWRDPNSTEVMDERKVASAYTVRNGRIIRYARHDSLEAALHDVGLQVADRIAAS